MKRLMFGCLLGWIALLSVIGCSQKGNGGDEYDGPKGQMSLALVTTTPSGHRYRLRDGVFDIIGMSTGEMVSVSTETDPDRESIDVTLRPDFYAVYLNNGWRLERLDSGSADTELEDAGVPFSAPGNLSEVAAWRVDPRMGKLPVSTRGRTTSIATPFAGEDLDGGVGPDGGSGPVDVDADLVSENPVFVEVVAGGVSPVQFVFMIGGLRGELSIGIQVIEDGEMCTDEYEPNNDFEEASVVSLVPPIHATACPNDDDFYRLNPPVAPGEPFAVDVSFAHSLGDIDAVLFNQFGEVVSISQSVSDDEQVGAVADGGPFTILVFLFGGGGQNEYTMSYGSLSSQSDCCSISMLPGQMGHHRLL